ncbi:F-box domain protein [Aspergillus clavatus NRRL 1]|uniref:Uncharacterized protein n=1 Tax=Aspergillus clavatus (strain ATCC 1007 / CBS 513.65 / DSM 816 / NCTC 3887 / NRRL 1 / QM 1276 / 107) TaxID=344612 RepID=A1C915_ASPCL|nr:uncharacterized protein ACLA_053850 [Aspergillus clavatus NRRL 1]EAW13339.1 conserved hypothetical protein [Aspergillus clavatus NRRL 1]
MQWDFSLRVSRMIDVAANLVFMNVHPTLDSLTTVHLEQNDSNGGPPDPTGIPYNLAQLRIMKHWLTDTSNVTQAVSKVVALPEVQDIDLLIQSKTEISEAFNDRVGILIAQTRTRQPSDLGSIIAIAHDLDSDEIFLHVLPPEHTSPRLCLAPIDRNLLYYIRVEQGKPTIWISHPNAQIPYHPAKSMDTHFMRDSMHAHQRDSQEFVLKGDNDCVLLVDDEGMSAWCFDEAAQPSCAITGGIQLG